MKAMTTMLCVAALALCGLGCEVEDAGSNLTLTEPLAETDGDAEDETATDDPSTGSGQATDAATDAGGGNTGDTEWDLSDTDDTDGGDDDPSTGSGQAADGDDADGECLRGSATCECYEDFSCDLGLECDLDNICKLEGAIADRPDEDADSDDDVEDEPESECVRGRERCLCNENGTCNAGLVCSGSDLCVVLPEVGDDDASEPTCDPNNSEAEFRDLDGDNRSGVRDCEPCRSNVWVGNIETCNDGLDNDCDDLSDYEDVHDCPIGCDPDDGVELVLVDDVPHCRALVDPPATGEDFCLPGTAFDAGADGCVPAEEPVVCDEQVDADGNCIPTDVPEDEEPDPCTVGTERCACVTDGADPCGEGLMCLSNLCVQPPPDEEGDDDVGDDDLAADDDSTGDDDIAADDDTAGDDDVAADDDATGDDDDVPPDADSDGTPDADDCAPANASIHPGVAEVCDDSVDNNCNGLTDSAETSCASAGEECPRGHEPLMVKVFTPSLANERGVVFNYCRDNTITNAADCVEPRADWVEPGFVAENAGWVVADLCVRSDDIVRMNTSYYNTPLAYDDAGNITVSAYRWLCEGSGAGARLTALVDITFRGRLFTEEDDELGTVSLGGGCSAWLSVSDLL